MRSARSISGWCSCPPSAAACRSVSFSDSLALPSIGLAVVNFDNNQHAANENIRVGHFWEAIEIFAALATMPR